MFENVQFFSHLHLKKAKSAVMTQKNFFLEKYQYGYQKHAKTVRIWSIFITKVESKKPRKNAQKRKYSKFAQFFGSSFFYGHFFFNRHQRI
jgi:hypothetical protein